MIASRQKGLSLISLLIGLFISMLCILAGMTLYKSTLTLSGQSKIDADLDGQLISVLLTLQQEIQRAGYGIAGAGANAISRTGTATSPVLAWRYLEDDGVTFRCRGVVEYSWSNFRSVALIDAQGCNADVALNMLTWIPVDEANGRTTVIARMPEIGVLKSYLDDVANDSLFTFSAPAPAQCSPYGAVPPAPHQEVTVTVPSSAVLHEAAGAIAHSSTFCLLNTQ